MGRQGHVMASMSPSHFFLCGILPPGKKKFKPLKLCTRGHCVKLYGGMEKLGDGGVLRGRGKNEKENTAGFLSFGCNLSSTFMNMERGPCTGKKVPDRKGRERGGWWQVKYRGQ